MRKGLLKVSMLALALATPARAQQAPPMPGYPAEPRAPAGAPNVLVIMTDDVGFAASSTFGGGIPTPALDGLAAQGLRYNNFHTTALCSPTRAALLTGRNHHAVGFGAVADFAVGQPGYHSIMPKSAATIAQVLRSNGYNNAFFGKNHNVPTWQSGPMGPFDQWGTGLGFDYFYGFHGGATNQFAPDLIENTKAIEAPREPGYILDRDLADRAISWLRMQSTQGGGKPFFLYYAPGTAHAPLQAPQEWIERFRGRFDGGWDVYRAETFARQKRLGIIPKNAKLAPLPAGIAPWASLTPDQKRVYARYMEVYAAALAYCDNQVGRILDDLRARGQLDNTLIMFIQGDNGASPEGGENGAMNYNGRLTPAVEFAQALARLDEMGGPNSFPVPPAGWAVAMDTPFPYYKVVASRLGGIRNGMVVSWPKAIRQTGIRSQFLHVTDIAPTIYEAVGIMPPKTVNGVEQQPIDGISFRYSFDQPAAPTRHRAQYFEILGSAAMYEDGWLAATRIQPSDKPGHLIADMESPWLLYDLNTDFSQTTDVSAKYPERLAHLRGLFDREAKRNHVYPMTNKPFDSILPENRPEPANEPGRYVFYPGDWFYPEGTFPSILNRDWTVEADLDVPVNGGSGALVTQGGQFSGWGLVMRQGIPNFLYRLSDTPETLSRLTASAPLAAGPHKVTIRFASDGAGLGQGGALVMLVDGREVAKTHLARTASFKFGREDAMIGRDAGTPIDDYPLPFTYDGTLRSVTVEIGAVKTGKVSK
ncbi:MAG: arylsulfatase [Sphingomonadales bacterium]|nr:MAG: arylsulfatase [Sphingomonadales bacterium]